MGLLKFGVIIILPLETPSPPCKVRASHGLRRRSGGYTKVTQQPTAATHTVRGLSTPLPSPPSAPISHWQPDLNGNVRGSQGEADGQSSLLSTLD